MFHLLFRPRRNSLLDSALAAAFLASALGLFLEMAMVRWHSSCVHTFGVFKNVSMLSCFLGLGIGYARARRDDAPRLGLVLPLLAVQCLVFAIISRTRLGRLSLNPVAEHYMMWQSAWRWWFEGLGGNVLLAATFLLNAVMFVPLGVLAGRHMSRLQPLAGYACNLAGSLAGVALFVALSALWSPPVVWFSVAMLGLAPFLGRATSPPPDATSRVHEDRPPVVRVALQLTAAAAIMLSFGVLGRAGVEHFYSPYQTITCRLGGDTKLPSVARLTVNQASFQRVLDLSAPALDRSPELRSIAAYYDLPHALKPDARRVLVVGAGTGNDVAAALRANPEHVTAVEIDPTILFLGRRLHPERPYDDPRVAAVTDDARTFLCRSRESFDLVVYGLLDSHTTLGSLTNVRLDSFVYTVEGFRDAAARLSDDGLIAVTFAVMTPEQGKKMFLMLEQAFGESPRAFAVGYDAGVMMVAGPGLHRLPAAFADERATGDPAVNAGVTEITSRFTDPRLITEVSTDDWPFFYMPRRAYPDTYVVMIGVLLALSVALIVRQLGVPRPSGSFGVFFFLGAGFMLIETKAITELGLVLGNTWHVLAVVVASILVLAFLANLWVMHRGPAPRVALFALLSLSVLAGWAATRGSIASAIPAPSLILPVLLTLPLFFSGLMFSGELARLGNVSGSLAANLFGAMLGGFLEYNSMYFGYASLNWFGLSLYATAFLFATKPWAVAVSRRAYVEAVAVAQA